MPEAVRCSPPAGCDATRSIDARSRSSPWRVTSEGRGARWSRSPTRPASRSSPRARGPGVDDHLHRRHRARRCASAGIAVTRCRRGDRLPRDPGRARQDAAPARSTAASSPGATDPTHAAAMAEHGIEPIDLVVVNLYPFEETVGAAAASLRRGCVEQIDIGGPAMIRAAAKNYHDVGVVTAPDAVRRGPRRAAGARRRARRWRCAGASPRRPSAAPPPTTRRSPRCLRQAAATSASAEPDLTLRARSADAALRREPAPAAALYAEPGARRGSLAARAEQLHGKELSFNNLLDLDAALGLVREFDGRRA